MIYPDTVRCLGNSKGDIMRADLKRKQYRDAKGRRVVCREGPTPPNMGVLDWRE